MLYIFYDKQYVSLIIVIFVPVGLVHSDPLLFVVDILLPSNLILDWS